MIKIQNAKNACGELLNISIPSELNKTIDASGLIALPGLIDPHVHFRIPGQAYKEDWATGARAALSAGYTTVMDMPNNIPACVSLERLINKEKLIQDYLDQSNQPLRYYLYLGADRKNFDQISLVKNYSNHRNLVIGIKVFMGASTGDLLMEDESSLHAIFALAKFYNFLIAVHAEDNLIIQENAKNFVNTCCFADHSKIRSPEAAEKSVQLALNLAKQYGVRLYILHVSTQKELALIKKAKQEGVDVFAEACPHHLFLNWTDYERLQGLGKMNPPLRSPEDQAALLAAVRSGVIDTLGSDHAPHTLEEKKFGKKLEFDETIDSCPSGVPGIETNLPLLLNAVNQGKLNLQEVEKLCIYGPRRLFNFIDFEKNNDWVLVDMNKIKIIKNQNLHTKSQWSPFSGMSLQGWPVMTICRGMIFGNDF